MKFFLPLVLLLVAAVDVVAADAPPSFRNEIVPLLTRYNCNMGACHGKQAGQNGFRLSLRGFAPELDHGWLTREFSSRRVSKTQPQDSLVLKKALGLVPHGGGKLFAENSQAQRLLAQWIEAGAPGLDDKEPRVVRVEVQSGNSIVKPMQTQQLKVLAHFDSGEPRDVTWLAKFFSNDDSVLDVTADGLVTVLRSGESVVRVHFLEFVEVVPFSAPFEQTVKPELFAAKNNGIDEHVFKKLADLHIPPASLSDDATFLRRAFLDATGTLPSAEEAKAFLADTRADKRAKLIDELLERPEFIDFWTIQLADILQNRKERDHDVRGAKGVRQFHAWLRQKVAANQSWSEIAREVLTATGDSFSRPEVGYFIVTVGEHNDAERSEVVASVAQSFLGTRIGCAQCHNHPLERFTQDDYYHFAAFFSRIKFERQGPAQGPTTLFVGTNEQAQLLKQIKNHERQISKLEASNPAADEKTQKQLDEQRKQLADARKRLDEQKPRPVTAHQPRTNKQLAAQPLDRVETTVDPTSDPRIMLADWMTKPTNAAFSGNMVNRLWKHFFNVGLVEPVDDLRPSNPPSNAALWQHLNEEFVASGFNLKHVMRLILNSRTYQLGSETVAENRNDRRFYSHYFARRLPAEVMLDAVSQTTGVAEDLVGYATGVRAAQVPDPTTASYFMSLFGRSERVTACACERNGEVTLPQLLHLQNGDWITAKLRNSNGTVSRLVKEHSEPNAFAEAVFLTTLSRLPTTAEREVASQILTGADSREDAATDLFWSLLTSKEFSFNH